MSADLQGLIKEFGSKIGIPDLALDHDNRCNLMFNDVAVSIESNAVEGSMYVYSYLTDIPSKISKSLSKELLQANLMLRGTDGMTVGVDKESKKAVLICTIRLMGCNLSKFMDTVEKFIKNAEQWTKNIRYYAPGRGLESQYTGGSSEEKGGKDRLKLEDSPPPGMRV